MKKIGFFVGSKLAPDAKNFLINMRKMFGSDQDLDVIGNFPPDPEINKHLEQKAYFGRKKAEGVDRIKQGFFNCRKYILSENPDLIFQITKYPIYGIVVTLAGKLFFLPTIVRLTGDHFRAYKFKGESVNEIFKIIIMQNILGTLPLKLSTRVAVLSDKIKNEALRKGCEEDKIDLLPQPIDKDRFSRPTSEEKKEIREKLDLPQDKKIIIYVGRLTKPKGMDLLEKGLSQLEKKEEFLFCLIGNGPYGPKLEKEFPDLVRFEGFVDTDKVHEYYRSADLLVHPSPLEGVPNTLLEAMATGLPIIARKADYSKELGVPTFEDEEGLIEMIEGDWKITDLPDRFEWENLKQRYVDLINKTIDKGGK